MLFLQPWHGQKEYWGGSEVCPLKGVRAREEKSAQDDSGCDFGEVRRPIPKTYWGYFIKTFTFLFSLSKYHKTYQFFVFFWH